jgi:hypothetical protein
MVFLLLLFSPKSIFYIYKKDKAADECLALVNRSVDFGRRLRLTPMVLIVLPPHYLIRLGILFLSKWRVYDSLIGFGVNLLFFSSFFPFFHFSFFFGLQVGHAKSYINPSISFFF